jgi:hypothetical protein
MRALHLTLLLAFVASPATAQTPPRPPKPYPPIAITRPPAFDDASFTAFRGALAAAAKSRIYAGLAPLVVVQGFFWDRDFGRQFDQRRPAVDNLAAAVALEQGGGTGWDALAAFAADASAEPLESRPGVICAPARPGYDSVAFSRLLDVTYTSGIDWAYPRDDQTPVHSAPQPGAVQLDALGAHFVRVLGVQGTDSDPAPGRNQWKHVALPDGRTGYVAPDSLMSLGATRLCYIKDPIFGWRVAGVIVGGIAPGSAK